MSDRTHRGLFLDLDGTLADTLPVLRKAYRDFLARFGAGDSDAEFQRLNGPPLIKVVAALKEIHGLAGEPAELYALYLAIVAEAHRLAPPIEGARLVLERARLMGWIVTVVTSARHQAACAWLVRQGLDAMVSVVVGGDDVDRGKPDPDPYLVALERTGCAATLSLAVEDSWLGALAAVGAGLPTIVVGMAVDEELEKSALFLGRVPTLEALAERL